MTDPKLSLRGVAKSFEGTEVLRSVDLDVAPHEVVCLIGSSGSGKSTLLQVHRPAGPGGRGDIVLDGVRITDPPSTPIRCASRSGSSSRRSTCSPT